jgi:IclR family KDG regulon transcriptional repressor
VFDNANRHSKIVAVKSVSNAIRILEILGRERLLGVTRISQLLDLPKSSVHDILATLRSEGMVEKDSERNRYSLGLRLFELGNVAKANFEVRRIATPFLRSLNEDLDETVHLTILDGWEVLYIECFESTKRLRTYSVIGVRAPLHCTAVGKAILAFFTNEQVSEMIRAMGLPRFTENTITDREGLFRELAETRRRGYAVDDAEHEEGVRCVGAPIRNHEDQVVASVSVSGPSQRITPERDEETGRYLIVQTDEISRRLGYKKSSAV